MKTKLDWNYAPNVIWLERILHNRALHSDLFQYHLHRKKTLIQTQAGCRGRVTIVSKKKRFLVSY